MANSCHRQALAAGLNDYGQSRVPKDLSGIIQITTGTFHTCAVRRTGTVICWGAHLGCAARQHDALWLLGRALLVWLARRRLHSGTSSCYAALHCVCAGDNDFDQCAVPSGLKGVVQVAAGLLHTCALKKTGTVICWGAFSKRRAVASPLSASSRCSCCKPCCKCRHVAALLLRHGVVYTNLVHSSDCRFDSSIPGRSARRAQRPDWRYSNCCRILPDLCFKENWHSRLLGCASLAVGD